ncbi:MAG: hypothetical protein ACTH8P_05575 [Ewingella sp.]
MNPAEEDNFPFGQNGESVTSETLLRVIEDGDDLWIKVIHL